MSVSILHENLHLQVLCKMQLFEVGVGQILNMEMHDIRAVVKHGAKS